jgi:hypothetical protein
MATFQAATEAMTAAAATLARNEFDVEGGHSSLARSSGALAGTPAAAAFATFVGAADDAVKSLGTATDGLSRALNAAAGADSVAEATAPGTLEVSN